MLASFKASLLNFMKEKFYLLLFVCFLLGVIASFLVMGILKTNFLFTGKVVEESVIPGTADVSSDNPEKSIVVDLSGAIKNPGVYKLTEEARIADLLNLGGGVLNEASGKWVSRNLNLSKKLIDSDKIYIPFEWEVTGDSVSDIMPFVDLSTVSDETTSTSNSSSVPNSTGTKVNVNTASVESLDSLPGIGEVYSQKIISNRPYKDSTDLQSRTKISVSTLDKIKDLITF